VVVDNGALVPDVCVDHERFFEVLFFVRSKTDPVYVVARADRFEERVQRRLCGKTPLRQNRGIGCE